MVATLSVRRMGLAELVIQSPQIRLHFRLYLSPKRLWTYQSLNAMAGYN